MPGMGDVDAPTLARVWGTWSFSPVADTLLILATAGYLALIMRAGRAGHPWPVARLLSFLAGVLVLVIVVNSSVVTYSHSLFWVHMIAHLLLIMVAPVLFIWAAPWRLLDTAGGGTGRALVAALGASRVWRFLTSPAFTVPLYTAMLVLTHLTGFQQAMATHMWIHDGESLLYLVTGYLLFLPLVGSEATVRRIPYLIRFVILAATMGVDTLVGVVLMLTGIRRRELLGDRATEPDSSTGEIAAAEADVDIDQELLDAYNARLAALDRGPVEPGTPRP